VGNGEERRREEVGRGGGRGEINAEDAKITQRCREEGKCGRMGEGDEWVPRLAGDGQGMAPG